MANNVPDSSQILYPTGVVGYPSVVLTGTNGSNSNPSTVVTPVPSQSLLAGRTGTFQVDLSGWKGTLNLDVRVGAAPVSNTMLVSIQDTAATSSIRVYIDSSNRPGLLFVVKGVTVAAWTPSGGAIASGTRLQLQLIWDARVAFAQGNHATFLYADGSAVNGSWGTAPANSWLAAPLVKALVGWATGYLNFAGTVSQVQIGDSNTVASAPGTTVQAPSSVTAPDAPTNVVAVAGDTEATITWDAPASDGGSDVILYTVTSDPEDISAMVAGSELEATVTGLTNGLDYTFTVTATNSVGTSAASTPSNTITPDEAPVGQSYWYPTRADSTPFFLSSIPWVGFTEVVPPTTTRQVTVSDITDFNTEAAVNGTEITILAGSTLTGVLHTFADDLKVIYGAGAKTGDFIVHDSERLWITSADPLNKGVIDNFNGASGLGGVATINAVDLAITDMIFNQYSQDLGDSALGTMVGGITRLAFIGNIGYFEDHTMVAGGIDWMIAGNNTISGGDWNYRHSADRLIHIDNWAQNNNTSYDAIRINTCDKVWITGCTLNSGHRLAQEASDTASDIYIEGNSYYGVDDAATWTSAGTLGNIVFRNNIFYSDTLDQSTVDTFWGGIAGGVDVNSPNTFNASAAMPSPPVPPGDPGSL